MRAKHETNSIKEDLWMAITDKKCNATAQSKLK